MATAVAESEQASSKRQKSAAPGFDYEPVVGDVVNYITIGERHAGAVNSHILAAKVIAILPDGSVSLAVESRLRGVQVCAIKRDDLDMTPNTWHPRPKDLEILAMLAAFKKK